MKKAFLAASGLAAGGLGVAGFIGLSASGLSLLPAFIPAVLDTGLVAGGVALLDKSLD